MCAFVLLRALAGRLKFQRAGDRSNGFLLCIDDAVIRKPIKAFFFFLLEDSFKSKVETKRNRDKESYCTELNLVFSDDGVLLKRNLTPLAGLKDLFNCLNI